jgi:hypothetical protein
VIFDHDHYAALGVVQDFLASRGIISTGRYGAWNYSSMGDALAMGKEAAETALALLREAGP